MDFTCGLCGHQLLNHKHTGCVVPMVGRVSKYRDPTAVACGCKGDREQLSLFKDYYERQEQGVRKSQSRTETAARAAGRMGRTR